MVLAFFVSVLIVLKFVGEYGLGSESVRDKVKKYNGYFRVKIENQHFIAEVSMRLRNDVKV